MGRSWAEESEGRETSTVCYRLVISTISSLSICTDRLRVIEHALSDTWAVRRGVCVTGVYKDGGVMRCELSGFGIVVVSSSRVGYFSLIYIYIYVLAPLLRECMSCLLLRVLIPQECNRKGGLRVVRRVTLAGATGGLLLERGIHRLECRLPQPRYPAATLA